MRKWKMMNPREWEQFPSVPPVAIDPFRFGECNIYRFVWTDLDKHRGFWSRIPGRHAWYHAARRTAESLAFCIEHPGVA